MVFHTNFTVMIHTVAVWLTLSLAIWRFIFFFVECCFEQKIFLPKTVCCCFRFIMIKFPSKAVTLCTIQGCKFVLIVGYGGKYN